MENADLFELAKKILKSTDNPNLEETKELDEKFVKEFNHKHKDILSDLGITV